MFACLLRCGTAFAKFGAALVHLIAFHDDQTVCVYIYIYIYILYTYINLSINHTVALWHDVLK